MDNVRIVIKPKGLTLLLVIINAVTRGVVGLLLRPRPAGEKAVVGGAPAKNQPGEKAKDLTIITDGGELEEKKLLADLNKTPGQEHECQFLGAIQAGSQIDSGVNERPAQEQMDRIMNTAYLPDEAKYRAKEGATFNLYGKTYTWKKYTGSAFDFKEMFKSEELPYGKMENLVVYGVTHLNSNQATKKVLSIRSDDGVIWLNGNQVYKSTAIRGVRIEDKANINLREGDNVLLVKVGQGVNGWGMALHLKDRE